MTISTASGTASPNDMAALPDNVRLTGTMIQAWRQRGFRISEYRSAGWLYLLARREGESAVYKIVGPVFEGTNGRTGHYHGSRIA